MNTSIDKGGQPAKAAGGLVSALSQLKGAPLKIFLISLGGYTLVRIAEGLYFYVNQSIAVDFGVTQQAMGVVISASAVIGIFVSIICGSLADVIGRKKMFGVTIIGTGVFIGLQSLSPSLVAMTILRGLSHGFWSSMSPIKTTIVTEASPARFRGILTGFLQAGSPIGASVAGLIAVNVIQPFGWRWGFSTAFLIILPGLILWWMLGESKRFQQQQAPNAKLPKAKNNIFHRIRELYGGRYRRNAVICTSAAFMLGGGLAGSIFFWQPYFETVKGLTGVEASTIIGIGWGVSISGFMLASVIGEFVLPRRDTFVAGMFCGVASLLGLVWLAEGYYPVMIFYVLVNFFILGVLTVFGTLINESFPTHIRSTASTVCASSGLDAGVIVFPIITTTVAETWLGWNMMFSTFVAIPFLIAGLLFLLLPRIKSGLEVEEVAEAMHGI